MSPPTSNVRNHLVWVFIASPFRRLVTTVLVTILTVLTYPANDYSANPFIKGKLQRDERLAKLICCEFS